MFLLSTGGGSLRNAKKFYRSGAARLQARARYGRKKAKKKPSHRLSLAGLCAAEPGGKIRRLAFPDLS